MPQANSITLLAGQKHDLTLEINKLKVLAETGEKRVVELSGAVTDMVTRIDAYKHEIEDLQKEATESIAFIGTVINEAATNLHDSKEFLENAFKIIGLIEGKLAEQTSELKKQRDFERERRVQLHKDMEENGRTKKDLELYTERLQKKYDELGMGKIII